MNVKEIIAKKKRGLVLSEDEIRFVVDGYTAGGIPDYQMSAWLMAVCFQSMNAEETAALTRAMVESGDQVDLSPIHGIKVDKHSTGGVGDKISLIVIPVMAALGIPVAKMSGRGLGHTGGTIDKLESIPGFRVELTPDEFIRNVNQHKMAIVGQSGNLTPADKKIYALRDVTETVDSVPLIASSIMSKKIASGADAIVLDVKVGSGAFMKTVDAARQLARAMVDIGTSLGRKTVALLTNMDQPLGNEVGNYLEVEAAIDVLRGKGAEDEVVVATEIAAHMAVLGGACSDIATARDRVRSILSTGEALSHLKTFVSIQGGNPDVVDHPESYRYPAQKTEFRAFKTGFVGAIDAEKIGHAAMLLGAGRETKEDRIDFGAGIAIRKKIGDPVNAGDVICELYSNRDAASAISVLEEAYTITSEQPQKPIEIYEVIQ